MEFCLKKFVLNTANPHLKLSTRKIEQIVSILIQSYMRENNLKKISVLDIGGGKGFLFRGDTMQVHMIHIGIPIRVFNI